MKKLYCLELNGIGEPKEIEVRNFLSEETIKKIEEESEQIGIKLEIKEISDPEPFVESYFKKEGYKVFRTQFSHYPLTDKMSKDIKKLKGLPKDIRKHAVESGVPDWFCFKDDSDWFFVEVKNKTDGLKFNQVQWIIRNKYPTKLIFVEDIEKEL